MSKKKFNETKVGKFLLSKGSDIVDLVGNSLPDNGVLGLVKNILDKDDTMPQQDKEIALELLKQDEIEMIFVLPSWIHCHLCKDNRS